MEVKNYITAKGLKKLTDELEHILKVEHPEVTKVVTWAASLGDRSENADYQYGKKRLRELDRRIRFLSKRIESAEVVTLKGRNAKQVQFGATVTICDDEGAEKIYSIVGVDETDPERGLISWTSPIGKALLSRQEGDSITVRAPSGDKEFEILNIEYGKIDSGE